jgi:hypothetical protein
MDTIEDFLNGLHFSFSFRKSSKACPFCIRMLHQNFKEYNNRARAQNQADLISFGMSIALYKTMNRYFGNDFFSKRI